MTHLELMKEIVHRTDVDISTVRKLLGNDGLLSAMRTELKKGNVIPVFGIGNFYVDKRLPVTIKNQNINGGLPVTYATRRTVKLRAKGQKV